MNARGASQEAGGIFRDPVLAGIVLAALLFRLLLLATIDRHAHYDEAIVGVMARHILTRGEHPLFFYGQNYGGGGAVEAYAAALLFSLFGESAAALKMFPLLLSLAAIPLTYAVARDLAGRRAARLAALFFATAPPTLEWSIAARGGYAETILGSVLLVTLLMPALAGRSLPRARWFAAGAIAGFSFYVFGLIAPTIAALFVLLLLSRPPWRAAALPALAGGLVGAAPIVYDNIAHGFINLRHLTTPAATSGPVERVSLFVQRLIGLVSHDLPAFFTPWIDDFVEKIPPDAWVYALATAGLAAAAVGASRRDARLWLGRARRPSAEPPPGGAILPALFVGIYGLLYAGSRFAGLTPRYLLGLYPLLAVLSAQGAEALLGAPKAPARALGAVLAGALVAIGLGRAALLPRPSELREYKIVSRGDSVPALVAFLDAHAIRVVFATPPIKWKLLWEGKERILAATQFFQQEDGFRYPEYERTARDRSVFGDEPAAIVTHAEFGYESTWGSNDVRSLLESRERWEEALSARGVRYQADRVGDYLVYHAFSANVPRLLRARECYVVGKFTLENGDPAEAAKILEAGTSLDPDDPELARLLGEARMRAGAPER